MMPNVFSWHNGTTNEINVYIALTNACGCTMVVKKWSCFYHWDEIKTNFLHINTLKVLNDLLIEVNLTNGNVKNKNNISNLKFCFRHYKYIYLTLSPQS